MACRSGEVRGARLRTRFPSPADRPHSRAAISNLVAKLEIGAAPHGFRSSFRDWAAERPDAPPEVCELLLAYVNTNAFEGACRRTDLFKWHELMDQGARFLTGSAAP